MQIFVSWSGAQSHAVAVALRDWLPKILGDKIVPFVSSEDIDKGSRGLDRIAVELEESSFGIVVVTPINQHSAWINFEAGALGKSVDTGRVAPLLVGMADADLVGPLKQFQNSAASDKDAVRSLAQAINKSLGVEAYADHIVIDLFNLHWLELDAAIAAALESDADEHLPQQRSADDILDEVLTTVRSLQRDVAVLRNAVAHDLPMGSLNGKYAAGGRRISTNADLLAMIFSSLQGPFSVDEGLKNQYRVFLQESAPKVPQNVLDDVRVLAVNQKTTISIHRPDGSSIVFKPNGDEERISGPTVWETLREDEHRLDAEADESDQTEGDQE